jgi:hypothetical protein
VGEGDGPRRASVLRSVTRSWKQLGREPGVREVLQQVAGGGAASGFVRDWKKSRLQQQPAIPQRALPQAIVDAIAKELEQGRSETESALRPQVDSERERADTLQNMLAQTEGERDELRHRPGRRSDSTAPPRSRSRRST